MKSKIVRACAAAVLIGTLLLAGTAPYGPPGVRGSVLLVDGGQ